MRFSLCWREMTLLYISSVHFSSSHIENKLMARMLQRQTELTALHVNVAWKSFPSSSLLLLWHSSPTGWALTVRPVSNNVSNSVTPPEDPWQLLHALRYCPYCSVSIQALLPALCPPSIPQRSNADGAAADGSFRHVCWDVTTEITDQLLFSDGFMPFHKLLSLRRWYSSTKSACGC